VAVFPAQAAALDASVAYHEALIVERDQGIADIQRQIGEVWRRGHKRASVCVRRTAASAPISARSAPESACVGRRPSAGAARRHSM
jgi:hypothetical protein